MASEDLKRLIDNAQEPNTGYDKAYGRAAACTIFDNDVIFWWMSVILKNDLILLESVIPRHTNNGPESLKKYLSKGQRPILHVNDLVENLGSVSVLGNWEVLDSNWDYAQDDFSVMRISLCKL